jgi:hypothetical protein
MYTRTTEKTAFSTGQGLWQFTVMPFGLCNTLATFDRLMETLLQVLMYNSCLVYLDDMIIIGRMFQQHWLNLQKVFERFQEACLKINLESVTYYRREYSTSGILFHLRGYLLIPKI